MRIKLTHVFKKKKEIEENRQVCILHEETHKLLEHCTDRVTQEKCFYFHVYSGVCEESIFIFLKIITLQNQNEQVVTTSLKMWSRYAYNFILVGIKFYTTAIP